MSSAALFRILYQNETLFRPQKSATEQEAQPMPEAATELPKTPEIVSVAPPAPQPAALPEPDSLPALREIVILADERKHHELIASETLFLDNILKAVKHSVTDATILNLSYLPDRDARKALADKRTHYFITFGVPLIKIHLDLLLPPYTPKLVDGVWFLLADPLVVIEADRNLKKKLWQALQKMFEVS